MYSYGFYSTESYWLNPREFLKFKGRLYVRSGIAIIDCFVKVYPFWYLVLNNGIGPICITLNSSLNFFVYYFTGTKFRKEFYNILKIQVSDYILLNLVWSTTSFYEDWFTKNIYIYQTPCYISQRFRKLPIHHSHTLVKCFYSLVM